MKPLSATEAVAAIEAGTLTSEKLVRGYLDRIAERDAVVKAWAFLDPDLADRAGARPPMPSSGGVLRGVPIGVKDIIDTHDMPTGHNSPIFAGARCRSATPPAWRCCRTANAVILGKTVTTEFANRHPGPTTNPHNPGHTPGGSSSGSAAAVADGHVPLAFGTPDRRLGDPPGGLLRRHRLQADLQRLQPRRHQDAVPFARHAGPDGAHAGRHRPVPRRRAQAAAGRRSIAAFRGRASASAARRSGTRPRPTPRRCSKPRRASLPTRAPRWSTSPSRPPSTTSSTITARSRAGRARATTPTSGCAIPTR